MRSQRKREARRPGDDCRSITDRRRLFPIFTLDIMCNLRTTITHVLEIFLSVDGLHCTQHSISLLKKEIPFRNARRSPFVERFREISLPLSPPPSLSKLLAPSLERRGETEPRGDKGKGRRSRDSRMVRGRGET